MKEWKTQVWSQLYTIGGGMQLTSLPWDVVKNVHISLHKILEMLMIYFLLYPLQQFLTEFKHLFCKLSKGWKADFSFFFAFLMHGCATDFLARRCSSEECAGFFRRTHVTSCSGCQNWIIPRMGKVSGGVETSLWQDTQSLFLKSTHQGTHLTRCIPSFCPLFEVHIISPFHF